jgi:hypothetical protein
MGGLTQSGRRLTVRKKRPQKEMSVEETLALKRAWEGANPDAPEVVAQQRRREELAAKYLKLERDEYDNILADEEGGDVGPRLENTGGWAVYDSAGNQTGPGTSLEDAQAKLAYATQRGFEGWTIREI